MSDTEQVFNVKCLCYIVSNLVHLLLSLLPSHCCILCLMQKLKTKVVKKNLNPEWNDDLTLSISDPHTPIHLHVYDKDLFSMDDKMGDAEFDIGPFFEAVKMRLEGLPNGTIVTRVQPSRKNCLAEESHIVCEDGKVSQNMVLRLRNVECGEVELQLLWTDIPGSTGL
ncbi:putative ADP-ribosylation factor GTPase-activating protein [Trifolium pratense]|uniref:Putative ADP-ribosylation factor GTPase-activating protein n=1 Tax=Trifolium pratense TaxID=57577 RepID=A0A2K3NFV4_TRIPR|nr:putative ADP-ribosylation factor GTPase-activating protein [Trifolium pratense]